MANFANTTLYSPTHPILLRNLALSDAEAISQILSAPSNTKFDPMCSPTGITVEQASKFITRSLESASQAVPNSLSLVLVLLPSIKSTEPGTVIGLGGFGGIDVVDEKRFGDVGIMINEEFRGRGFAVESLRLSIDFAVGRGGGELGLDGVTATMLEGNEAMVGVLEKKMRWVGESRESKFGMEKYFRLSPGEWVELKGKLGWM